MLDGATGRPVRQAWLRRGDDGRVERPLPVTGPLGPDLGAVLVTFAAASLRALEPRIDLDDPAALALVPRGAMLPPGADPYALKDLPLPPDTPVLDLRGGVPLAGARTAAAEGLDAALALRVRRRTCRPGGLTALAPWDTVPLGLLEPDLPAPVRVVRLDARSALALHDDRVWFVTRDRPLDLARPGPFFDRVVLATDGPAGGLLRVPTADDAGAMDLAGVAVAPSSTRADGLREVLVAAGLRRGEPDGRERETDERRGALWRLWLGPDGLRAASPDPIAVVPGRRLHAVAIAPGGQAVAVGDRGTALLRARPGEPFGPPEDIGGGWGDKSFSAVATGDPARPLAVSSENRLHRLDAARGVWLSTPELARPVDINLSPRALAVAPGPGGEVELWAAGSPGTALGVLDARGWRFLAGPDFPGSYAGCGGAVLADGVYRNTKSEAFLAAVGRGAFNVMGVEECDGVVFLRREDLCVHVERAPPPSDPAKDFIVDVDAFEAGPGEAGLLALTARGALLSATWREASR